MKCVICRQGETQPGTTTVTLERGGMTLVIKGVPARVCDNCGEEYVDERVTEQLLATADQAAQAGVQVDVRQYVAA
jgi:YgiT-type zinc finger domain-containing protein